jgi:hypothetical protein
MFQRDAYASFYAENFVNSMQFENKISILYLDSTPHLLFTSRKNSQLLHTTRHNILVVIASSSARAKLISTITSVDKGQNKGQLVDFSLFL